MKIPLTIVLAASLFAGNAHAEMRAERIEYKVGSRTFENVLVYDDAVTVSRPGLVMVPDWLGINADNIKKAKEIAGSTYVVMLTDMYGKGVRPNGPEEAKAQIFTLYNDPPEMRRRINASLQLLHSQQRVAFDRTKVAALGYCFGGTTVLELARSGASLDAVASFHGGLLTGIPANPGGIKASVLVLNGADDVGTKDEVEPFQEEMRKVGADWMLVNFAGAEHCFALPHAKRDGCRYHPVAAMRSERIMREFFAERFDLKRNDITHQLSGSDNSD